jgi:Clp amino terminal domain, pathogenicity island component
VFERFTRDGRTVVVSTQELCRSLGADEVRPAHLLLALTEDDSSAREVLAAHGLTPDAVAEALGAPGPAPSAPLGDDDAAALRSLGIDLDAIRAAVDKQFGEGALEGAGSTPGATGREDETDVDEDEADLARGRFGVGGHVRFGRGAKKVLELSLREAIRQHSREIRSEHIALAVLRTDDEAVRMLLGTLGVDVQALRADLEGRGRRSA